MKVFFYSIIVLCLFSCAQDKANKTLHHSKDVETSVQTEQSSCQYDASKECQMTAEMALEGVNNYCHEEYDWSIAEENPDIMGIEMGEETDSTYEVVFQSYTGAKVFFYVDKASGQTRMEEYVPALDIRSDAGTIDLSEYLKKQ